MKTKEPSTKHSQRDAAYVPHATKRYCAACSYFQQKGACEIVAGTISPDGSCRYYERKTSKN